MSFFSKYERSIWNYWDQVLILKTFIRNISILDWYEGRISNHEILQNLLVKNRSCLQNLTRCVIPITKSKLTHNNRLLNCGKQLSSCLFFSIIRKGTRGQEVVHKDDHFIKKIKLIEGSNRSQISLFKS